MASTSDLGGVEDEEEFSLSLFLSFSFLLSSFFFRHSSSFILHPTCVAGKNFGLPVSVISFIPMLRATPLSTRSLSLSTLTGKAPEKNPREERHPGSENDQRSGTQLKCDVSQLS
jgi:hypothetical protein